MEINRGIVRVGRFGVFIYGVLYLFEYLVDLG